VSSNFRHGLQVGSLLQEAGNEGVADIVHPQAAGDTGR
jgi:hypothetical protein